MKKKLIMIIVSFLYISTLFIIVGNKLSLAQDSVFFQSGFETGDYTEWTGNWTAGGASQSITSTTKHHGDFATNITLPENVSGPWATEYKTLDSNEPICYGRCYIKWDTIYTEIHQTGRVGPAFYNDNGYGIAWTTFGRNSSGAYFCGISYWSNGSYHDIWTPFPFQANIWYCVELHCKIDDDQGNLQLWIDGDLQVNGTNLDTDERGLINRFVIVYYSILPEPNSRTLLIDDCVVSSSYIGPETTPSIGEFAAPYTVYANQYFYLNTTIQIGRTLSLSDFANTTIQVGDHIVLQWMNNTNSFSVNSDPYNQVTLNASTSLRRALNLTSYELSWHLKLNNYPSGVVAIKANKTKVFDSGGFYGSNNASNLFYFISQLTTGLQTRDADGQNLTRPVSFNGTMANGTSFSIISNSNGYAEVLTCFGTTSIDTWWGDHLVQTTIIPITENTTVSINTRIQRLISNTNYLLFSLNGTTLPHPSLIETFDWKIENATGDGTIEFKMDNADWIKTSEPYSFTVENDTYFTGWFFANNIFTFPIQFTSLKTLVMSWVPINYTLNIITTDGGSTNPIPGTHTYVNGTEVTVSAIPDIDYIFGQWKLNGIDTGSENPITIIMKSNYTLEAIFIYSFHDIALTDVTPHKTIIGQGDPAPINFTVSNLGNYTETFNIILYANSTEIDQLQLEIDPKTSQTLTFTWNTTDFTKGKYNITALAEAVLGETNTDNNTFIYENVLVTISGDVDGDQKVDIFDIVAIALAYGSGVNDPAYHPHYDLNFDGNIDIFDIVAAANHYGESW